jgi:ribosomal protein S18 acetylase RimI-like enzyme
VSEGSAADRVAWERMLTSMRAFFRGVPSSSGGRVIDLDGVIACVTPAVPERSLPNSVVYESEEQLIAAIPQLADTYEEAGVLAWTVWVPEYHSAARAALADAGHVLDANPAAMIAELGAVDEPRPDDPEPDPRPTAEDLGAVNDLAYGTGDAFQRMLGRGPLDPRHVYVAREDGRPLATVVSADHEGDTSVWWVATVPEARGRGLAPGLMRRALAAGRARGNEVTTLQATKLGRPVYDRLGYRSLGAVEMWERRKPA